jgi:hypothetical protein
MNEELKVIALKRRGWAMVQSLLDTREMLNSIEISSKQSRIIDIISTGRPFRPAMVTFAILLRRRIIEPGKRAPEACFNVDIMPVSVVSRMDGAES